MPKIIIDHREIRVPAGTKVIEAARQLGIMIPRFCYHPALGSVGACRVCAVAFKEGPVKGIQMSCMVDAEDEMVVSTTDPEAVDFRRSVIEWLMLNHPHDCPVCDVGGNCLLQDMTVSGGHGLRRFPGKKRTHNDQYLGPLIQHEMNRCIQCYRCSRYYQEYAGYHDLGVMGSASRVYFGRSQPGRLQSPFSGNLLEVCPTGVYTDKPSRYFGRRWEFERASSVCLHCSLGCNLVASARYRQVVRHEARLNVAVNGYFICDRGRYGFAYASDKQRPRQPLANGQAGQVDEVIDRAREKLSRIVDRFGSESIATVASHRSSLETLSVLQRACEDNKWQGPSASMTQRSAENLKTAVALLTPETAVSLGEVSGADTVVVIGADPVNEAPMLALSLRQVERRGGHVAVIDPRAISLPLAFDHWAVHPGRLQTTLENLIHSVAAPNGKRQTASEATEADRLLALTRRLQSGQKTVVVCGTDIVTCRVVALAADLVATLRSRDIDARLFFPLCGASAFATGLIELAGQGPASIDQVLDQIEDGRIRALIIVENDLWHLFPDRRRLAAALHHLELLVVMDHLGSPLNEQAQFFIPTQTIYEAGGRWVNNEGRLQVAEIGFSGGESIEISGSQEHPPREFAADIPGAQPIAAWRGVAALAQPAGISDADAHMNYLAAAVRKLHPALGGLDGSAEGQRLVLESRSINETDFSAGNATGSGEPASNEITLLLIDWTFGTEPVSSQSPALSQEADEPVAKMHPDDIQRIGLGGSENITISADNRSFEIPLVADDRTAPGVIVIPRHHLLQWQIFADTVVTIKESQIQPG